MLSKRNKRRAHEKTKQDKGDYTVIDDFNPVVIFPGFILCVDVFSVVFAI